MRKGNRLIQEGKVPKKRTLNTQVLTDIANGYYLDGIEAGYHAGYDKGYEEGTRHQDEVQYQKGLDDAWAAARKIMLHNIDGLLYSELNDIFGNDGPFSVLESFSASEAVEKIREYEKKQKNKTEIKVGTRVRIIPTGIVGTVTEIDLFSIWPCKVSANGTYWWYPSYMLKVIEEDEKQKKVRSDYEEDGESTETGHWIVLDECSNSGYYCSKCHKKVVKEGWSDTVKKIKFCPNCGIKMIDPKESKE